MSVQAQDRNEGSDGDRNSRFVRSGTTMSERFWGIDWKRELPWNLDAVTAELGAFETDALPFMQLHYSEIFPDAEQRWYLEPMTDAKLRYMAEADVILFRSDGETVGLCVGHPTDWSTYYVRTVALLPSHRDRGVVKLLHTQLPPLLARHGVVRLEADSSPANRAILTMFTAQGWLITSTSNHDRWGSMLKYTMYLEQEAERVFRKQFIYSPRVGRGRQ